MEILVDIRMHSYIVSKDIWEATTTKLVLTNERLPLEYAQHSCMYLRTMILDEKLFLKLE